MLVAFPVDHRYGWDIAEASHQTILDDVAKLIHIYLDWFSPRCSPWSKSNRKNELSKQKARLEEHPALTWVTGRCRMTLDGKTSHNKSKAAILETPHGSALLEYSPFAAIYQDKRTQTSIVDQCQHGAQDRDGRGLPNKKRTILVHFNFTLSPQTLMKCEGDLKCPEHGELQGKIPGTNITRTSLSAVYPWNLCFNVMQDILNAAGEATSWPLKLYWACKRCKHGKKMPDKTNSPAHTFGPGCRFNREKIPPGGVILGPEDNPPEESPAPIAAPPGLPEPSPAAPPTSSSSSAASPSTEVDDKNSSTPLDTEPNASAEGTIESDLKLVPSSDYIEPSFNIRELKKKLLDPALTTKQRLKLLLGLHYKMRHLPAAELKRMMLKGGYGKENADLADQVVKSCTI